MSNLSIDICGIKLKNPVIAASGTFGFGREYNRFYDIGILGGICTKGLTLLPKQGNASPRIAESNGVILNSVGLQNPSIDKFIEQELGFLKNSGTVIIANLAGSCENDYLEGAKKLDGLVDMIELNISCPNVKEGGIAFGVKPKSVEIITKLVKDKLKKTPLVVKLSPNVESIEDNAQAAECGGADAISLINTFTGMVIDLDSKKPILKNITGGVSGAGIKPIALRMVYQAAKAVKIPLIGIGGIRTATDALEFIVAGATAVQVGTANFTDVYAMPKIIKKMGEYLDKNNIKNINLLKGAIKI